jgi:sugar transferase (PEP-CTERM/EpsH1 system associated)
MAAPLITHVIYSLTTGGLENGLVNIINRSPTGRYRHVIICIATADEFAQRITAEDVQVIQLKKREGHDPVFYRRLWRLFRELRPDIIHSRNLAALETQLFSIGCPGVKRVHGEHGREVNDLDGSNWKYLALRRFMRLFVHSYIAVSRDLEHWLIDRVGVRQERVRQIYNGVDSECFSPQTVKPLALLPVQWQGVDDRLIVGTVGRLTPVKDQRFLLQAVAHMRDCSPELSRRLRVIIVGDGPLREELESLAGELDLGAVTWFTGDRDDVAALLNTLDVFVLPSMAEGISNTLLEAMACGLPVVVTAVGGNLELVEEGFNGSLVPVGEPRAMARALARLLGNDTERARLGDNARQRACQSFDWNNTVADYLDVYDELLQVPTQRRLKRAG